MAFLLHRLIRHLVFPRLNCFPGMYLINLLVGFSIFYFSFFFAGCGANATKLFNFSNYEKYRFATIDELYQRTIPSH